MATALEHARQSRNEAVHGWPGGLNGLFVKSRQAPVAVSERAVRQRLRLSGAGAVGGLARPGVQQHPHLHGRAGVADGVGESLRGDLLGIGQGRGSRST